MDEFGFKRGWSSTNTGENVANPAGSLAVKTSTGSSIGQKCQMCPRVVGHEQRDQRNTDQIVSRVRARRDVGQRLANGPGGEVGIPMGAQLSPGFKNVLPAERKLANRVETHS